MHECSDTTALLCVWNVDIARHKLIFHFDKNNWNEKQKCICGVATRFNSTQLPVIKKLCVWAVGRVLVSIRKNVPMHHQIIVGVSLCELISIILLNEIQCIGWAQLYCFCRSNGLQSTQMHWHYEKVAESVRRAPDKLLITFRKLSLFDRKMKMAEENGFSKYFG